MGSSEGKTVETDSIRVSGIDIGWHPEQGTCAFDKLPVAMMWVDTTLAGLMSGVQAMVGTERFVLALQSEGRKSVEADWQVIAGCAGFREGFEAIANIAAVAGWGRWLLTSFEEEARVCRFRVTDSWEGRYQKALGVCWGSGMIAGKLAGYCSRLFGTNCWADQTGFIARGDACDEFVVKPSPRSVEKEIDGLLATDEATRADMAVALRKLAGEIAERQRIEHALRESTEKFRSLVETTSDWIWETDAEGVYTYASPRVRELLGYEPEEVIGRTPFDLMAPEEARRVGTEYARTRAECRPFSNLENHNLHKNGRVVILETSGVPRLDAKGNLLGYRGIDRDITDRALAAAERLDMERRLLHAQKLESLGVMAGGIAHDFNNLLMAVLGNLDLALLELLPGGAARPFIEQALRATRRGADLTRQMLAYSGKGRFVITRIDLSELVRENTNLFRTAISRTVTMIVHLTREASSIEADPGQLQQVIMNLITNAAEAIGEQTGVITLTTGLEDFDAAYLSGSRLSEKPAPGRFAFVEVSDTGCGMDEEIQQRLFDPFFSTKFTGRGLGMAAVLGIVRGHGGAILLRSAIGHGSTIRVLFPASAAPVAAAPVDSAALPPRPEPAVLPGTILVVDDEESVRGVCLAFARRLGLRVLAASDGGEALALFTRHANEIGVVLLDLTMPRMDGIATFRELKRLRPEIPVILCSGYDEQQARQHFAGEGLAGFVQKPFTLQMLQGVLSAVLDGRTGRDPPGGQSGR